MRHFVYILRCADGSLYTGYTTDVDKRLAQHNGDIDGGARYTRGRRPVSLVWKESHPSKEAAMQREYVIKQMTRIEKLQLLLV